MPTGTTSPRRIQEGEVKKIMEGQTGQGVAIVYPSITSCLTVTCHLRNNILIGAHMGAMIKTNEELKEYSSSRILGEMRKMFSPDAVFLVDIIGVLDSWGPDFLGTDGWVLFERNEWPVSGPTEMAHAIKKRLGLPAGVETRREHYESGFTEGNKKCAGVDKFFHELVVKHNKPSECRHTERKKTVRYGTPDQP
ncbi:hypothetical protein [Streptomyces sp. NPDC037389]|uniref:hypothetical protein n=1 Tax=Streptomyces sp. NPDC037389 TaxID=3155369 RepID=UPI0033C5EE26